MYVCAYKLGKAEYPNLTSSTKGRIRETTYPIRIDMKDVIQSVGSFLSAPFKHALSMVVRKYLLTCMYVCMYVWNVWNVM